LPKVVFDSSFLMALAERPTTWHEDITALLGGFEPVVLDCVLAELKSLSGGPKGRARYASLALELSSKFEVRECGHGAVDDEILSLAQAMGAAVATVDGELIGTMRALGIRGVTLREGRVAPT
jgi:rRNA-processing protein FCF1